MPEPMNFRVQTARKASDLAKSAISDARTNDFPGSDSMKGIDHQKKVLEK